MKVMKKSTAVLLALLIAFSAMSVTSAADGVPAEGRDPFIAKEADCRIDLEYTDYVIRSEKVQVKAVGSYIDSKESGAVPVEGDIRIVPVKWTAKQADTVIDNGDWTELRAEQTAVVNTENVKINDGSDSVEVVVEVEFAKQEYKDGKWETIGEYTGSNKIIVKSADSVSFISLILSLVVYIASRMFRGFGYGSGSAVANAINRFAAWIHEKLNK